jgi:hypothetical protein
LEVAAEDIADDLGLFLVDLDGFGRLVVIVAKAAVVTDKLAPRHDHLEAGLDVLGGVLDLLLGTGREDGDHDLAALFRSVDALFLEADGDVLLLEGPDVVQVVHRVAPEPRERLHEDDVDLAVHRGGHHLQELGPLVGLGSRKALVGVDPGVLPFGVAVDQAGVIGDLALEGVDLLIGHRADPAIRRHPDLPPSLFGGFLLGDVRIALDNDNSVLAHFPFPPEMDFFP